MRKALASTLAWLVCATPVMAQDAAQPVVSPAPEDLLTPAPNTNQQQKDTHGRQPMGTPTIQSIEDGLRKRLARAGFTDIEMIPTSFLVRAKDAHGNAVMLVLSPDTVAEYKQVAPRHSQRGSAGTEGPVDQQKF